MKELLEHIERLQDQSRRILDLLESSNRGRRPAGRRAKPKAGKR
jgi:hypothetical protein